MTRILLLHIALTLGNLGYPHNVWTQVSSGESATITGIVQDSITREPIAGAAVKLTSTTIGAFSDSGGRYVLQNIPPGHYSISGSYFGYEHALLSGIVVTSGVSKQCDIVMYSRSYHPAEQAQHELSQGIVHLWAAGLLIGPVPDSSFTDRYGFRYISVGCDPTGVDIHNFFVEDYLTRRNGKHWYEEFRNKWESYLRRHKLKNR